MRFLVPPIVRGAAGPVRRALVTVVSVCVASALASPCAAQDRGAAVVARLHAAPGAKGEARARLSGDRLRVPIERSVDVPGIVAFTDLPWGTFQLAVSAGPASAAGEATLTPGETVVFDLQLGPEPAAPAPPADRWSRPATTARTEERRRDLPSSGNLWSLLETVEPAAILDRIDGAGLHLGGPGRFSMRGASWTQNTVLVDGVDVTDTARGGVPLAYPDVAALGAVQVSSLLSPVEIGSPGVALSAVPQDPGDRWSGSARLGWLPSGLQAERSVSQPPAVARFASSLDGGVVAGGPVRGQALRTLVAASAAATSRVEGDESAELRARVGSLFNHTVWQPRPADTLRLVGWLQAVSRPLDGRARYSGEAPTQRDTFLGGHLRWERTGDFGSSTAHAGFRTGSFEPRTDGRAPDRAVDRLIDGPVPALVVPEWSRHTGWSVGGQLALRERHLLGLRHALRLGATLGGTSATDRPGAPGVTAERVGGLPARVWDYGWPGAPSHRHAREISAFVADGVRAGDRLFVEAGLRLDADHGSADGSVHEVDWVALSPRISVRLRLTDAGHVALVGGYAEYQHRLLLDYLSFADPAGPHGSVYRWDDRNGDGRFDPDERGVLVARVGPGAADGALASIDPELRAPRTREWVAGIQGGGPGGVAWSLFGFDRRERDLVESVDVGVSIADYAVRFVPDPAGDLAGPQDDQLLPVYDRDPGSFGLDRYRLTNPPGHEGRHQGLEVRVEGAIGSRIRLEAGATAVRMEVRGGNRGFRVGENDQGVVGELYDDPNADTHALGRSFFDRAYTIKLAATGRLPGDVRAGLVARYQDGQPFNRFVVVSDLAQGPEAIPAVPRGQISGAGTLDEQGRYVVPSGHRFAYTLSVDARVEKGLSWGGKRIALAAEAFNLLDTDHEVEEDPVSGPGFRQPTLVQPPRAFRFGARLDF